MSGRVLIVEDERPMVYMFSSCINLIRTLPIMQHDTARPEDVDSNSEDHAADTLRYACASRPLVKTVQPRHDHADRLHGQR